MELLAVGQHAGRRGGPWASLALGGERERGSVPSPAKVVGGRRARPKCSWYRPRPVAVLECEGGVRVRRVRRMLLVAASLMVASLGLSATPAVAVELATDYPSLSLRPGDTATFELRVISAQRERVDFEVTEAPEGWTVRLLGGGREVAAVIADPDPSVSPSLEVEVEVPVDAAAGTYELVIEGSAPSGPASLPLQLTVTELAAAPFELTADFPELSGGPDQTFTFDVNVANNTGSDATFAIEASGPTGWTVDARPTGQAQATTLTVAGGESGTLQVQATPTPETTEGRYPIDVRITAGDGTVDGQFTAVVTGTPQLVFQPAEERLSLSAEAGSSSTFALVVANDGTAPLTDVVLSASAPTNWEVTFEPETIPAVGPGETTTVTARVTPASGAVAGDYAISMTAAGEAATANLDVRVQVETSTWWGFVAIAIIVVALVGLGLVFRRFGRR